MEETSNNISTPTADPVVDRLKLIEDRLDITPQGLEFCFERKEFLKETFDVDKFIVERKKRLALESLKDDLMAYLRILKSSLVELINQDYADFVNLSTNLVGLDRAITSIQTPMEAFQANIEEVNNGIAITVRDIEATLAKRQAIRNRKILVQNARSLACCIDRLEAWLGIGSQLCTTERPALSDGAVEDEEEGRVLERVGTEYTKLQYFARKCDQQDKLLRHIRPRMNQVAERLHARLDSYFLAALPSPEEVAAAAAGGADLPSPAWATPARGHRLRTALRVFVNTDRSGEAMLLLRRHLMEPLLDSIELDAKSPLTPEALENLFAAILLILPAAVLPLRRLMAGGSSGSSGGPLADLDLVTSAVWPAVVQRLTDRLPHLFSAGQADAFHANYTASMAMTAAFEEAATSAAFRTHPVTVQFMAKWTLPVYMQLRFQEIATEVEEAVKVLEAEAEVEPQAEATGLRLRVCQVVLRQLRRCWAPNVFLAPLAHRFWKLSLQLLARFATLVRASCSTQLPTGSQLLLLLDSFALAEHSRLLLHDMIEPRLMEMGCTEGRLEATFRPAFDEGLAGVAAAAATVEQRLAERIETECATHLRLVQDVPRQYRKTNRESPSKPAAYANNLLRPLSSFLELHAGPLQQNTHGPAVALRLTVTCTEQVGRRYREALAEVLESVRKMEDSLRLLRKARGQPTSAGGAGGSGVSDDAKIRQQLLLDARHVRCFAQGLLPPGTELPPDLQQAEELAERELAQ